MLSKELSKENIYELFILYNFTQEELARFTNTEFDVIDKILKDYDFKKPVELKKKILSLNKDNLEQLYVIQNKSILEIAHLLYYDQSTIYKKLKEYGFIKGYIKLKYNTYISEEELRTLYIDNKIPLRVIAFIKDMNKSTLEVYVDKYKLEKTFKKPTKEEVIEYYINQNHTRYETATHFYMSIGEFKKYALKFNIIKPIELREAKRKESCMNTYGVTNPGGLPEVQKKIKQTNKEHWGTEYYLNSDDYKQKNKEWLDKHGVINAFQIEEIKEKSKQTMIERRGVPYNSQTKEWVQSVKQTWQDKTPEELVDIKIKRQNTYEEKTSYKSPAQNPEVIKKMLESKKQHNGIFSSIEEDKMYELIINKGYTVERQYKSKVYPFYCDFYINELDLYIEYQGYPVHGKDGKNILGPYNENLLEHQQLVSKWKEKSVLLENYENWYISAINTWTVRDPLKRETAKKNNLNWMEFFTIDEFMKWYETLPNL